MPKPGYEAAYFNSRDQNVTHIEPASDGVVCTYESLRREGSGENDPETIPVRVRYQIRIVNRQVLFSIEVDNPTDRKLAEVMYGIIGGQQGIGNRLDTESIVPGANTNIASGLFSRFHGGGYGGGNLGIRYDAAGFSYPGSMSMGLDGCVQSKSGHGLLLREPGTRNPAHPVLCRDASLREGRDREGQLAFTRGGFWKTAGFDHGLGEFPLPEQKQIHSRTSCLASSQRR
jgi:hypothetical protein